MRKKVHSVEELKREYWKVVQSSAKPTPIPYKPRWLNAVYAFLNGNFWLPCPMCGKKFGGHEWYEDCGNQGVCPECSIKIWNKRVDKENYKKKMQLIWDKCKHGKWKSLGISGDFWQEVQCGKCGFVQALACQHGGSVACQNCVNSFLHA